VHSHALHASHTVPAGVKPQVTRGGFHVDCVDMSFLGLIAANGTGQTR
jgi:hypothetical protein